MTIFEEEWRAMGMENKLMEMGDDRPSVEWRNSQQVPCHEEADVDERDGLWVAWTNSKVDKIVQERSLIKQNINI